MKKIKIIHIPELIEVLDLIKGEVPLLIELKYDNKVGKLENELMQVLKRYTGEYAIQSFNPLSVNWIRKYYPDILRGQLSSDFKNQGILKQIFLKNMLFNFISKPDFIAYDINGLSTKQIQKIKRKYCLLGWTVKDKDTYKNLIKQYDNLICEYFI